MNLQNIADTLLVILQTSQLNASAAGELQTLYDQILAQIAYDAENPA